MMKSTPNPPAMVTTIRNGIIAVALIVSSVSVAAAQLPDAPASLSAIGAAGQVNLSWPAVSGATGYRVSRGIASGIYGQFFDLGAVTSYADTAVTNATPYFYVVAAKNALGTGPNSIQTIASPLLGNTPMARWAISGQLYKQAGMNAEFKLYPGVKHTVNEQMRTDVRAFLLRYR